MNRREALSAVDAALAEASRRAAESPLPAALRERILASSRPAPRAPRGRLVDFVLRASAVAAAIVAVLLVLPLPIEAAEFDATPFVEWNSRLGETVGAHLAPIDAAHAELSSLSDDVAWPAAIAALAFVGTGLVLTRRGHR